MHAFFIVPWWGCSLWAGLMVWAAGLETDLKRPFSVAGISVTFTEMDEEEGKAP